MKPPFFRKSEASPRSAEPLLPPSDKAVTDRSLTTAQQRVESNSLVGRLLMPSDQRRIANELNAIQAEAAKDIAIRKIQALADLRGQQIELDCERQKAAIRHAETNVMGDLTRHASVKMAHAMGDYIKAERTWQTNIANSDCSDDDRQFLASLANGLARMRFSDIAKQHGSLPIDNESDHSDPHSSR